MPDKSDKKTESVEHLKKQTVDTTEVKKGYNENNPVQTQGSFKPDSKETTEVAPKKPEA